MIAKPKLNQKYDYWLHWFVTNQCNFDCSYCFGKVPIDKKWLRRIQIDSLMQTLNKFDKKFRISFTGGEPFLIPNLVEACEQISINHFLSVNSNLILPQVEDFAENINPEKVIFIQASFHGIELGERKMINNYINHFLLLREKGFNIIAEAVAYPPNYNKLISLEKELSKNNIELTYAPYIGKYNSENYPLSHSDKDIENFNLDKERISFHYQKGEICNAGKNVGVVYSNGDVYPCFQIKNKIGNIYEDLFFYEEQLNCPAKFCGCPLNKYDPILFNPH